MCHAHWVLPALVCHSCLLCSDRYVTSLKQAPDRAKGDRLQQESLLPKCPDYWTLSVIALIAT